MKFTMNMPGVATSIFKLEEVIEKRDLPAKVKLELTKKGNLLVKISKIGTSKLLFYAKSSDQKTAFELATESVSFWHRNHIKTFYATLRSVVLEAGGTLL